MKFLKVFSFIIGVIVLIKPIEGLKSMLKSKTKVQAKNKAKKFGSMMEFLNGMFTEASAGPSGYASGQKGREKPTPPGGKAKDEEANKDKKEDKAGAKDNGDGKGGDKGKGDGKGKGDDKGKGDGKGKGKSKGGDKNADGSKKPYKKVNGKKDFVKASYRDSIDPEICKPTKGNKHKVPKANKNNNTIKFPGGKGGKKNKTSGGGLCVTNSTYKDEFGENEILKEGWLEISSPTFRDTSLYPPAVLPDGNKTKIMIDDENFRANDAYNPKKSESPKDPMDFWFRLSYTNFFYSNTITDLKILGNIDVPDIGEIKKYDQYSVDAFCFSFTAEEAHPYKFCADSLEERDQWICAIKAAKKEYDPMCIMDEEDDDQNVKEKIITQPLVLIPMPSRHCNEDWNYKLHGDDWECTCREGREQSPIDLPPKKKAIDSPIKPLFQYNEVESQSKFSTLEKQETKGKNLRIQWLDNSLRIEGYNFGRIVTLDGAIYKAEEIVFHTPAEHTIDGKTYDMELQIIHYGQTVGDIAKQVILSILFEKRPGVYNKFIDDIDFFNLPNSWTKERDIVNNLYIPKVFYSADDTDMPIMRPFSFYTYQGSLTAPPCSERTIVYVASKPIKIGTTAIEMFKEALQTPDLADQKGNVIVTESVGYNNRDIQEKFNRPVFFYDHIKYCGPDPQRPKAGPEGHYERITKIAKEYLYINNEVPSGLPGAYVVSSKEALGKGEDGKDDDVQRYK